MKERPILFSGEMVRAILEGRKTQTRRVITPQPPDSVTGAGRFALMPPRSNGDAYQWDWQPFTANAGRVPRPYGEQGDRLWVRETFRDAFCSVGSHRRITYAADCDPHELSESKILKLRWSPGIHMPRWASRITLEITEIRVERVQEISHADATAEGCRPYCVAFDKLPAQEYRELWDKINAKRGYGWDANPWVWVIEFKPTMSKRDVG